MKKVLLIIGFFLSVSLSGQIGRMPYQTIRQVYKGDTSDLKLGASNVEFTTNLDKYTFEKSVAASGLEATTRLVIDNDTVFAIQVDTNDMYAVNGKYFLCTVKTLQDYVAKNSISAANGIYKQFNTVKLGRNFLDETTYVGFSNLNGLSFNTDELRLGGNKVYVKTSNTDSSIYLIAKNKIIINTPDYSSISWIRTSGDTLYLGDETGEYTLSDMLHETINDTLFSETTGILYLGIVNDDVIEITGKLVSGYIRSAFKLVITHNGYVPEFDFQMTPYRAEFENIFTDIDWYGGVAIGLTYVVGTLDDDIELTGNVQRKKY